MMCVHFRKRTKCLYCSHPNSKKEIQFSDCSACKDKEYKQCKPMKRSEIKKRSPIKGKKHRRTKQTEIQKGVKEAVWERDNKRCIFCNTPVEKFFANAHFIPRSAGGLGVERNMFTACPKCHTEQDNGLNTREHDVVVEKYLKSKYEDWDEAELIYKKY